MPPSAPILSICLSILAGGAVAEPRCAPFGSSEELPLSDLVRADPVASRATAPIEDDLLAEQIADDHAGPLTKIYCRIGMFEMTVRFLQPLRDDSLAAIVTEAVYTWRDEADPPGWQLSALRRRPLCARGDAPFAPLCP